MQKGLLPSTQYNSLFSQSTSANPQGAVVNEGLSGNAHILKSADNSVAYKNFTGSQIEDTTLVQDTHNKTVQTDWSDEHDPGVTSTLTETAPSINQQLTLSQSYNSTHTNLNETVSTATESHTLNIPNWEAYHQNIQTQIPTKLDQTLTQSGSSNINALQSQIQTQNISGQSYAHNFGTLNMNGPVTLGGNSTQVSGSNINIGGTSNTSQLTPICNPNEKCYLNTSADFELKPMNLQTYETPTYTMDGVLIISGHYNANNKQSAGPMPSVPRQATIEANLKQVVQNYFMSLGITATDEDGSLKFTPSISVSNQQGNYSFQNGAMIYQTPLMAEFQYDTETSKHVPSFESWEFDFNLSMNLVVTVTRKINLNPNASGASGVFARAAEYDTGNSPEVAAKYPAMARAVILRLATGMYELAEIE